MDNRERPLEGEGIPLNTVISNLTPSFRNFEGEDSTSRSEPRMRSSRQEARNQRNRERSNTNSPYVSRKRELMTRIKEGVKNTLSDGDTFAPVSEPSSGLQRRRIGQTNKTFSAPGQAEDLSGRMTLDVLTRPEPLFPSVFVAGPYSAGSRVPFPCSLGGPPSSPGTWADWITNMTQRCSYPNLITAEKTCALQELKVNQSQDESCEYEPVLDWDGFLLDIEAIEDGSSSCDEEEESCRSDHESS